MTRTESLAVLSTWAAAERRDPNLPVDPLHPKDGDDAVSHGLAAVRAIRQHDTYCFSVVYEDQDGICRHPCCDGPYPDCGKIIDGTDIISEARLAFRAALRAVGIRGAL